jgi:hypothetical protein
MEEWRYGFTILDLGTRWRQVVSFTPQLIYLQGKHPRHSLDRRLGAPQSQSGYCVEKKIIAPTGNQTMTIQIPIACHYTD